MDVFQFGLLPLGRLVALAAIAWLALRILQRRLGGWSAMTVLR